MLILVENIIDPPWWGKRNGNVHFENYNGTLSLLVSHSRWIQFSDFLWNLSNYVLSKSNTLVFVFEDETIEDVEPIDLWEEEEEVEPEVHDFWNVTIQFYFPYFFGYICWIWFSSSNIQIGDGGDGGGIVLRSCSWGEQALSIARDVLLPFGDDMELYSFKTSPHGYIYVRLDKLPNE